MRNIPAPKTSLELFQGFKYNYNNGPLITSYEEIESSGLNCQLFVHIFLEELGLSLPKWMRSKEIFEDERFLETTILGTRKTLELIGFDFSKYRVGDIFFFSPKVNTKPMYMHMVVLSGFNDNKPMFSHAVQFKNRDTAITVPLDRFLKSRRFIYFHGVKRVLTSSGSIFQLSEKEETNFYSMF